MEKKPLIKTRDIEELPEIIKEWERETDKLLEGYEKETEQIIQSIETHFNTPQIDGIK